MAALTLFACTAIRQVCDLSIVFIYSGFSIKKSFNYLKARRNNYLFRKYCRELWLEAHIKQQQCNLSRDYVKQICDGIKQKGGSGNFPECREVIIRSCNRDSVGASVSTSIRRKAHIRKMSSEIDFAATEYTEDAWETSSSAVGYGTGKPSFDYSDIEVITGEEVINGSTFYDYIETVPVYQTNDLGDIHEGLSFTVSGYILLNCERFSINLIIDNPTRDVALHINPRLPQNYIVRNSKVKNIWGREEVSSALPFSLHRATKFSIQILVTDVCYMISVNGQHFAEYNHRLPYKSVSCLEVKGDVDSVMFNRSEATEYPDRDPESQANDVRLRTNERPDVTDGIADEVDMHKCPSEWKLIRRSGSNDQGLLLPYYGVFPASSFGPGKCLKIEGRVKILPHSFYINLQTGQNIWPHPTIAFHFNPRFAKHGGGIGKHVVCRNSWHDGKWDNEERSELDTNFCPGKSFSLAIVCSSDAYEVYVNRKLITDFRFRVRPETVDTVYIQGDIKLWDVVLESDVTSNGNKKIYQNPAYQEDY